MINYAVSVIIPAYNTEKYIADCINSVLNQTLDEIEILVIDDCSTDSTFSILQEFEVRHNNVKIFKTKNNSGKPAIPRNIGLKKARGEYVAFLDSDDWVEFDMYESLYRIAKHENSDIVSANMFFFHRPDGKIDQVEIDYVTLDHMDDDKSKAFSSSFFSNTVNRIYRKEILDKYSIIFPEIYISEDFCFSVASHLLCNKTSVIKKGFYHYRYERPDSTTEKRKSKKAFELAHSFPISIAYFEKLGIFSQYKSEILKKYLNSFWYTMEKIDPTLKIEFINKSADVLKEYTADLLKCNYSTQEQKRYSAILEQLTKNKYFLFGNSFFKKGDTLSAINIYEKVPLNSPLRKYAEFNIEYAKRKARPKNDGLKPNIMFKKQTKEITKRFYTLPYDNGKRIWHSGKRTEKNFLRTRGEKPVVSVITTVFNNEKCIERALLSVLKQTYTHIEYIVVDAGSKDNTRQILKKFEGQIDYIVSEKDNGIYCGMNKALSLTSGDYIIILNSDDFFEINAIETLVEEAVKSDADIVFATAKLIDEKGAFKGLLSSSWNCGIRIRCTARHGTMLAKSETYNKIGFYSENYKVVSDQIWMMKAYEEQCSVSIVNKPILNFQLTGVSSKPSATHFSEKKDIIKKLAPNIQDKYLNMLHEIWSLNIQELENICLNLHNFPKLRQSLSASLREKKFGNSEPEISIQVPIFNSEAHIRECLESIQSQDFKNFEVICVDDGSTDGSLQIVNDFVKNDFRFILITADKNYGTLSARKKALEYAEGKYMMFVDADDILKPEALKKAYQAVLEKNLDFLQFCAEIYDPRNTLSEEVKHSYAKHYSSIINCSLEGEQCFENFAKIVKSNFWISVISKNVYKKAMRYIKNVRIDHGNDNYMMFIFAFFSKKFCTLNEVLYCYRASETTSNLTIPTPEKVRSHIESRARCLSYSLEFLHEVAPDYSPSWLPIPNFIHSTVSYTRKLMERCCEVFPAEKIELERIFTAEMEPWLG